MSNIREISPFEELARNFESNSVFGHMHSYDLYRKWLEAVWVFLNAGFDKQTFKNCLDQYTYEQGAEFGRLLGVYTDAAVEMPFRDILGELFMRLDVNSARSGQYFTPGPVAEMMARMLFSREDFELTAKEKGEVSVCDPAVGSGVMLLSYGKVVNDEFGNMGINKLRLYGTDIDERCVLMCRIQLRINGLDSFGRLAGIMGDFSQTGISHPVLQPAVTSEPHIDTINIPETPDISSAVILHNKERPAMETIKSKQMMLF